jgi:hypothetical protein
MNGKRLAAVALTGLLATAGTMAILAWAPLWAVAFAFTPGLALLAIWSAWLDHIPALAPRPGTLVRVNALGRPVRFQVMGGGQLTPEEAAELARRDSLQGLLGNVSGACGPKPPDGGLPATVAEVITRRARPGEESEISLALVLAELSARAEKWN